MPPNSHSWRLAGRRGRGSNSRTHGHHDTRKLSYKASELRDRDRGNGCRCKHMKDLEQGTCVWDWISPGILWRGPVSSDIQEWPATCAQHRLVLFPSPSLFPSLFLSSRSLFGYIPLSLGKSCACKRQITPKTLHYLCGASHGLWHRVLRGNSRTPGVESGLNVKREKDEGERQSSHKRDLCAVNEKG